MFSRKKTDCPKLERLGCPNTSLVPVSVFCFSFHWGLTQSKFCTTRGIFLTVQPNTQSRTRFRANHGEILSVLLAWCELDVEYELEIRSNTHLDRIQTLSHIGTVRGSNSESISRRRGFYAAVWQLPIVTDSHTVTRYLIASVEITGDAVTRTAERTGKRGSGKNYRKTG